MVTFEKDNLKCIGVGVDSEVVTYMIYPELEELNENWLSKMAKDYNTSVVAIFVAPEDWNNILTPWPEPGEFKGAEPFAGKAAGLLRNLQEDVIPEAEAQLNIKATRRNLIGVSLSGLFTLWQWLLCDTFHSIASLSGSFWYPGFMDWFNQQSLPSKNGKAYFLLGIDEPKSHIKAYQSVGENTLAVVDKLKSAGIATSFEWVPGNHFSRPIHRAEKAFMNLFG